MLLLFQICLYLFCDICDNPVTGGIFLSHIVTFVIVIYNITLIFIPSYKIDIKISKNENRKEK